MKKSILAMVVALILMTSLCGCNGGVSHNNHKEIYNRYYAMDSFYAAATVTVRTDKTESTYSVRQFFQSPNQVAFFVDSPEALSGSGYIMKDGKFTLKSGFGNQSETKINFTNQKNYMFLCDFFEGYYKSEETIQTASSTPLESTTTLTYYIADGTKEHFMQSLTIDNKTYLPLVLETCDMNKNPTITVEFNDFKRNCTIDERIFTD